jgi:hypothetical protein
VAYKDVTSVLKDKLVGKTRSSREVRSAQLHWPDSRIQLRCESMSTVWMGMYIECHNSFVACRLVASETSASEVEGGMLSAQKNWFGLCELNKRDSLVHDSRPVIPAGLRY